MKFIGSTGTTIIGLAFGGATFMALQVLVSPLFWSSLPIDESWVLGIKIGAAFVAFAVFKTVMD